MLCIFQCPVLSVLSSFSLLSGLLCTKLLEFFSGKCGALLDKLMDYKPVSTRTRGKRDEALLERYWATKANSGEIPASRKRRRPNQQASHSRVGESSSRKQSFEWVADDVESLENQQSDDVSKSFDSRESVVKRSEGKVNGASVGLKRKKSDDKENDGCKFWKVVSENGVEVVDLMDSDDDEEVVVSRGKEGGGVDINDVNDGRSSDEDVDDVSETKNDDDDEDEDVSSAEEDSYEESEFSTEEDSTDEDYDEGGVSSSDEESNEEDKEEEAGLEAEQNEKECSGESVEVGLKEENNANVDDLHSSCGQDIEATSETVSKGENVELVPEGKMTDDGDDQHSCSAHNTDVRSEQVKTEESLEIFPKGNANADVGDLHSSSGHNTDVRSEQVKTEESLKIFPKGNANADVGDLHSSSGHVINDRSEKLVPEKVELAEERTVGDRSDDHRDGRVFRKEESVANGSKETISGDLGNQCKKFEGGRSIDYKHGRVWKKEESVGVSDDYKDGRAWKKEQGEQGVGVSSKEKENRRFDVHNQSKKTSRRAPKQKRVPTVEFQPPKLEFLPQKFSFDKKPTVPEKSEHEREIEDLFAQFLSAKAYDNASTASKAKENNCTRSDDNRNDVIDETYGGSSEMAIDNRRTVDLQMPFDENEAEKGSDNKIHGGTSESGFDKSSKPDVQSACEKGVEAKGNNCSRSIDIPKNDNGETYSASHPEPYKKKEVVKKLSTKKRNTAPKDCNAFSILLDSIYDKGEVSDEKLPPFGDESPKDEAPRDEVPGVEPLPLFFTFGPPPSPPPEKSASEIEIDDLFDQFKFARMCNEIGSAGNVVESKDSVPSSKELTQQDLCGQGNHDLELDEEIGLICRYCPYVHQEIKYILPPFASNPYGKYEKRFREEDDRSVLDDLQFNKHNNYGSSSHAHTDGTVWDLIPGVESDMYPHQREGFEFIWRHLAGGIQLGKLADPGAYDGDGCIISHAPGTGKTRLTIIFIQSYMKFNPSSRPLIVAPRTMLLTWEEEFKKWGFNIPFHNLNNLEFTGKEDEAARNLVKNGNRSDMINLTRVVKLKTWAETRSILGISYSLFEQICGGPVKKVKSELSATRVEEAEQMSKVLLEFPGLVVFDEGHNPRNDQSHSWNALLRLKTRRRILLSGTPFQNNFEELYNTVRLVRPEWTTNLTCLGAFDKKQWPATKRNVRKGQFADDNTKRAREVKEMLSPFVHVYKGTILQDKLPGLRNSVLVLQPTALQQRYSDRILKITNPFKYEKIEAKVTIHPYLLLLNDEDKVTIHPSLLLDDKEYSADWESLKEIELNPEAGVKARFTVELIRLCQAMNERVLVFSQWISPLRLIRDMLRSQFHWAEGEEVIYMDGKCDAKQRQSSMSYFNDLSTKAQVMLASTKGCNEGISLVGASRVVLLDVTWNPSVERQAISRAYRLGQKKIVSIYHLLMAGTREENKYSRQVEKHRLSELVFSCSDTEAAKKIPAAVADDKILEEMVQHEKLKHIFQKITLLDEASYLDEDFEF